MKIVDHATTNRMADAALVLLDAAREAAKGAPGYRPGETNAAAVIALAVQAVIIADHMPAEGASSERLTIPPEFARRWRGAAAGLGMSIGAIGDPFAMAMALATCSDEMGRQALGGRTGGQPK